MTLTIAEKLSLIFLNNFRLSKLNLPVLSELNTEILFEKGSVTLNTMAEVNRSLLYIISLEVKKVQRHDRPSRTAGLRFFG